VNRPLLALAYDLQFCMLQLRLTRTLLRSWRAPRSRDSVGTQCTTQSISHQTDTFAIKSSSSCG